MDEDTKLRALSTICLSMEKTHNSLVMDAVNAKQAWDKPKKAFQGEEIYRRISLLQHLTSIRLRCVRGCHGYEESQIGGHDGNGSIGPSFIG